MSSKVKKIIRWIVTVILTLQFLAAGVAKLMGAWDIKFEEWGYSASFALFIGILEIMAVVGLYFKQSVKWAVILVIVVMVGAIYTHFTVGEYPRILHNLVLILMAIGILRLYPPAPVDDPKT